MHEKNNRFIIHYDTKIPYLIMFMIAFGDTYVMNNISNIIVRILPFNILSGTVFMYMTFAILYMFKLNEIANNLILKRAWDVWIIIIIGVFYTVLFYINDWEIRMVSDDDSMIRLMLFSIPVYLMSRSIMDYHWLADKLWIIGYVYFGYCLLINIFGIRTGMAVQQGYNTNMSLGYQFGLCAIIFFNAYLYSSTVALKRKINMILCIISLFFVIANGSRGTLMVCGAYLGWESQKRINTKYKLIVIPTILFLIYILWKYILFGLIGLMNNFGINSRTVAWLIRSDSNLGYSGRDIIYSELLLKIIKNPLMGYGILGDRALIGTYSHNLFIELLIEYGVILGGVFCVIIIYKFVKCIRCENTKIISAIIFYGILQLLVSGSYLHNGAFWLSLGIMFSANFFIEDKDVYNWE